MAESMRFKDLTAKVAFIIAVMDQRDEEMKTMKQSLTIISQYIENQQANSCTSDYYYFMFSLGWCFIIRVTREVSQARLSPV